MNLPYATTAIADLSQMSITILGRKFTPPPEALRVSYATMTSRSIATRCSLVRDRQRYTRITAAMLAKRPLRAKTCSYQNTDAASSWRAPIIDRIGIRSRSEAVGPTADLQVRSVVTWRQAQLA